MIPQGKPAIGQAYHPYPENETITIDELYREHAKAFEQAGCSVEFPTLGEACDDSTRNLEKKKAKLEEEGTNQADNGGKISKNEYQ